MWIKVLLVWLSVTSIVVIGASGYRCSMRTILRHLIWKHRCRGCAALSLHQLCDVWMAVRGTGENIEAPPPLKYILVSIIQIYMHTTKTVKIEL